MPAAPLRVDSCWRIFADGVESRPFHQLSARLMRVPRAGLPPGGRFMLSRTRLPRQPRLIALALLCAAAPLAGCSYFDVNQLWKLNRQPNMDGGDAYFSVPSETRREAA